MTNSTPAKVCVAIASLAVLFATASPAPAIVIDAIQDTWIRESAPDNDYNGDLISVWDGTTTDQRRQGVILFDLSSTAGVTIDSAFLELFDRDDTRSRTAPLVQQAFVLTTTPPSPQFEAPYTWNEYVAFDQANEVALSSLGAYNIAAGDMIDGYEPSALASPGDISLLTQARDNNSNLVALILKATSGERDWGDIEFDETPPRLVINEGLPVVGDFNGDSMVTIADYNIMVDPLNWLQEVPTGTRGDISSDGFVGLDDFSQFKPIYHAANPGGAAIAGVPEPSAIILLLGAGIVFGIAVSGRLKPRSMRSSRIAVSAFVAVLIAPSFSHAIVLEAVSEIWIRESGADASFENDLISVWNSFGNDAGTRRYGVVEFDVSSLSGVPIDIASLNLWNGAHGFSDQDKPTKQSAVFIDTTGGTQAPALTWNVYQNEYAASSVPFESFGFYDLPAQPAPDAYTNSALATAADRAVIAGAASGGNGRLTLVLIADETDEVEYAHSWGDGPDGFGGMNPQLLINELAPEIVQLTLRINATTGAMSIVNPGMDPAVNTMFDIDGYVISSPAGALNPGGFTGLSGAGQADWQIVAPTAINLSELSLDSSTVLSEGDSFSLGVAYTPGAEEDTGLTFSYNLEGGAPTFGVVEFISGGLDGDYNGDGSVDAADYVVWRKGGSPDPSPTGYNLWRTNFGRTSGSGGLAQATSVPEPTAICLLSASIAAGLALLGRCLR